MEMEGVCYPSVTAKPDPNDLSENSIFVSGENDGVFDKDDYILFFAEGPDNVNYDVKRKIFSYQSNLYSEKNFYFVTVSPDNGKRVTTSENVQGTFPVIRHFDDYVYHEADEYNELAIRPRMVW